jgi:hypothetical protein
MKRLIALLFAAGALATTFAPGALANNGRDHNGGPGPGNNCTGAVNNQSSQWGPNGLWGHACAGP